MDKDRIRLVFVNPKEVYYSGGILEFNTNGYLCLFLHQNGFDCVYYLANSPSGIKISDYQEKESQKFTRKGNGLFNKKLIIAEKDEKDIVKNPTYREFRSVVLPEWNKRKSAMVVRLDDLHDMVSDRDAYSAFSDFIESKKGIAQIFLVIEPENERLLLSDAFKGIIDKSIVQMINNNSTTGDVSIRDILFRNGSKCCLFLDRLLREDVKGILLDIITKNKDRFETIENIDNMIDYLTIITDEAVPTDPEFDIGFKIRSRKDCYDYLESRHVWKTLCRNSKYVSSDYLNNALAGDEILSDLIGSYKGQFDSFWNARGSDANNYIKYCLMMLCRALYSDEYKPEDKETKKLIIKTFDIFIGFSQYEDISFDNKVYISGEYLDYFFDCYDRSKDVFNISESLKIENHKTQIEAMKYYFKTKKEEMDKLFNKLLEIKDQIIRVTLIKNSTTEEKLEETIAELRAEYDSNNLGESTSFRTENTVNVSNYEFRIDEI